MDKRALQPKAQIKVPVSVPAVNNAPGNKINEMKLTFYCSINLINLIIRNESKPFQFIYFFLFPFKSEVKPQPTAVMEIKQEGPIIVKASKDKKKINQKVSFFF